MQENKRAVFADKFIQPGSEHQASTIQMLNSYLTLNGRAPSIIFYFLLQIILLCVQGMRGQLPIPLYYRHIV